MPVAPPMTMWSRDLASVPQTFSSWDNCMSRNYCKWPVIAVIIIGSLIAISVIWCCARCLCCGLDCCCGCFSCCNRCCPGPRGKKEKASKYADGPNWGPGPGGYNGGYQSHPPPSYDPPPNSFRSPGAQFATFDAGKKKNAGGDVHADSLPVMPSWNDAQSRKVEDNSHVEEVEMDRLNAHDEQKAPMLAHQAPSPVGQAGPMGAAMSAPYQDRAARNGGDLGNPYGQDGYHDSQGLNTYAAPTAESYGAMRGQSPYSQPGGADAYHGATAYGVVNQSRSPPPQAGSYGHAVSPSPVAAYGQTRSPPQHSSPYTRPEPSRQMSYDSYGASQGRNATYSPAPAYSPVSPQDNYRVASPPANNNGVPASLMPARGNTPQAQTPGGYQSYTAYAPPQSQPTYKAYNSQ